MQVQENWLYTVGAALGILLVWCFAIIKLSGTGDEIAEFDREEEARVEKRNREKQRVGHFESTAYYDRFNDRVQVDTHYVDDTDYDTAVPFAAVLMLLVAFGFIFLPVFTFAAVTIPFAWGVIRRQY